MQPIDDNPFRSPNPDEQSDVGPPIAEAAHKLTPGKVVVAWMLCLLGSILHLFAALLSDAPVQLLISFATLLTGFTLLHPSRGCWMWGIYYGAFLMVITLSMALAGSPFAPAVASTVLHGLVIALLADRKSRAYYHHQTDRNQPTADRSAPTSSTVSKPPAE